MVWYSMVSCSINTSIKHSGSEARDKGDARNYGICGILTFLYCIPYTIYSTTYNMYQILYTLYHISIRMFVLAFLGHFRFLAPTARHNMNCVAASRLSVGVPVQPEMVPPALNVQEVPRERPRNPWVPPDEGRRFLASGGPQHWKVSLK